MAKLKLLKFQDYDDMFDYYESNEEIIHLYTLDKLEQSWKSKGEIKTVDIYRIEITESDDDVEFLSIYEGEWEEAFLEMKNYFVKNQKYEIAARVRNFEKLIFNIIEE